MPAKTVIFSNLAKFDGQTLRILSRSEFIQMSGRAGRRGIDDKGIVITMVNRYTNGKKIEEIIQANTEPVCSMFHINLNTVLKNIKNKKTNNISMISTSLFLHQKRGFDIRKKKSLGQLKIRIMQLISPFGALKYLLPIWNLYENMRYYLNRIHYFNDFLYKKFETLTFLLKKKKCVVDSALIGFYKIYLVFFLFLYSAKNFDKYIQCFNKKSINLINILLSNNHFNCDFIEISGIYSCSIKKISIIMFKLSVYNHHLFFFHREKKSCLKILQALLKKNEIDIIYNIKNIYLNPINKFIYRKELTKLKNALKSLKIIHSSGTLTSKGLACSDINFEEDFILIHLVFSGKLNKIIFEKLGALFSIFLSQETFIKTKTYPDLKEEIKKFQQVVKNMQKSCKQSILYINIAKYLGKLDLTIPNLVYALSKGIEFFEINQVNILIEGNAGKNIKRLINLFSQLSKICEKLGDINLSIKFDRCFSVTDGFSTLIRSLYF
jgi:ATP-dependent RNA helicase DOB1